MQVDERPLASAPRPLLVAFASLVPGVAGIYAGAVATAYCLLDWPRHRSESAWFIYAGLLAIVGAAVTACGRPHSPRSTRLHTPLLLAAFAALTLALYFPALRLGLLSDDFVLLARASRHDFWSLDSAGFLVRRR
jgi:hypothetical protein